MGSTEDEIGSARTEIGSTATHMEPKSGPAQTESEPPVLHSNLSTRLLMPSFLGPRGKNFRPGDGRFGFSLVHCTIVALVTDSHACAAVLTGVLWSSQACCRYCGIRRIIGGARRHIATFAGLFDSRCSRAGCPRSSRACCCAHRRLVELTGMVPLLWHSWESLLARRVMATARSKSVASNIMRGFRKRCKEIRDLGGGAARRG